PADIFTKDHKHRLLVRNSMKNILPEPILANKFRGLQSSDIGIRIQKNMQQFYDFLVNSMENKWVKEIVDVKEALDLLNRMPTMPQLDMLKVAKKIMRTIMIIYFLEQF
ncbi:MAG: hypothetical protein ACOCUL_00485, partial [Bacteroidota bacterium]